MLNQELRKDVFCYLRIFYPVFRLYNCWLNKVGWVDKNHVEQGIDGP